MTCYKCLTKIASYFYTDFDQQGNFKPYCESCYNIEVTSVFPNIKPWGTKVEDVRCECGSEVVGSNSHSSWCPKGEVCV